MVQKNINQSMETVKSSTFADVISSKSTPIINVLQKPLKFATGTLFKVVSGTNEEIKDKDGKKSVRAIYRVQSLDSKLLDLSHEFEIKVKNQKCLLTHADNFNITFHSKMIIVAFDNLSHWLFNGHEGLNATGVRILNMSEEQVMKVVNDNHGNN